MSKPKITILLLLTFLITLGLAISLILKPATSLACLIVLLSKTLEFVSKEKQGFSLENFANALEVLWRQQHV